MKNLNDSLNISAKENDKISNKDKGYLFIDEYKTDAIPMDWERAIRLYKILKGKAQNYN